MFKTGRKTSTVFENEVVEFVQGIAGEGVPIIEDDRYNVVIFNYKKCEPIKSNVFRVGRNYFECEQIDEDEEKIEVIDYFNERIGKIIGKI